MIKNEISLIERIEKWQVDNQADIAAVVSNLELNDELYNALHYALIGYINNNEWLCNTTEDYKKLFATFNNVYLLIQMINEAKADYKKMPTKY